MNTHRPHAKKRVRKHDPDASNSDLKATYIYMYMADGTFFSMTTLCAIHELLKAHPQGVSADLFKEVVGADLRDPRNETFLNVLKSNHLVNVCNHSGGIHLTRRHAFEVHDNLSLRSLVTSDLPRGLAGERDKSGSFGKCVGVKLSDLDETYSGVQKDLDDMVINRELVAMPCDGSKGELVYFSNPGGVRGSQFLQGMWRSVELPKTNGEILNYLVEVGLRTKDEGDHRFATEKAIRDKQLQEEKDVETQMKKAANDEKKDKKFNKDRATMLENLRSKAASYEGVYESKGK